MKAIKSFFLLFLIIASTSALAQMPNHTMVMLHKGKMSKNKNLGRLLGYPVNTAKFKFDSSGYSVFYICEVLLSAQRDTPSVKFNYLIGQKNKDELLVTIDQNFNNSFLDDSVITIKLPGCNNCDFDKLEDCITLKSKYLKGSSDDLTLHIVTPCCFKNFIRHSNYHFLDTLNIAFESPFEKAGNFSNSDYEFKISLRNVFPTVNYEDKKNIKVYIMDSKDSQNSNVYGVADTMRMGRKFYKIKSLSMNADTIILQNIPGEAQTGYKVDFYAYNFRETDISTNKLIGLNDFNKKYVLMEFWGTWCAPCLSLHDDIIKLLETNNQVNYLGIALDNNIDKVKNYISGSPAMRQQVFVDMKSAKPSIINQYRVQDYPTFILINRTGKIVFREYGIDGFHQLANFLNKSQ